MVFLVVRCWFVRRCDPLRDAVLDEECRCEDLPLVLLEDVRAREDDEREFPARDPLDDLELAEVRERLFALAFDLVPDFLFELCAIIAFREEPCEAPRTL